jgi:hypothetical protein
MTTRPAATELASFLDDSTPEFAEALNALAVARAQRNDSAVTAAIGRLEELFSQSRTLADLYGRRRSWLEFDEAEPGGRLADTGRLVVPRLTFTAAVDDLVSREPRLAKPIGGEPMFRAVQRVHAEGGFALAKSADVVITERVLKALDKFLTMGVPRPSAAEVLAEVGDFNRAYADMAFRTNVNTAYNAGRYHQLDDPDIAEVMLAFEYVATRDADVRRGRPVDKNENHLAADNIVAPRGHEVWDSLYAPLGYGCRCSMRQVSKFELKRRNMLNEDGTVRPHFPPGWRSARAADGFGGRPT